MALVLQGGAELVELGAGALLDPGAPEIDDAPRGGGGFSPVMRSRAIIATASSSGASARSVIS